MHSGKKLSIVFLSGLLCDASVWEPVAKRFSEIAEIDIFSFAGFDDFSVMAAYVLAHSPVNFVLVGHSMGARVALEVYRKAPQKISHLALLNTGVHGVTEKEIAGREKFLNIASEQGMEALAKTWLPPMMSTRSLENSALMDELYDMVLRHSLEDFQAQIHALLNRPDAEEALATVNVPTLLMSGSEDNWSPVSQHEAMQKYLAHSQLVELQGLGHMSIVEDPDTVANELKTWLNKNIVNHDDKLRANS